MVTTPAASSSTVSELKIVFTGRMGAGKTTAIRAISDGNMVSTDVPISDKDITDEKTTTTVGLDYGECKLSDDVVLKMFGTPGQERFRFMWDVLGKGAFGLIVLADNSSEDPVGDVAKYLKAFSRTVPARRTVVGVGRLDTHPTPSLQDYCDQLGKRGFVSPIIDADVRRPEDVRLLLSVLVSMAEIEHDD